MQILSFLALPRVLNYFSVAGGYLVSRIAGSPVHWGKPVAVSVEPTNRCNLRCPECPSGMHELERPSGSMSPELFRNIIDQLSPELLWLTLYFQGEPFLNPSFIEMVGYARSKGIVVSSSTNGHYLSPENCSALVRSGLSRLIVSVDGTDQETYGSYRVGGSLEKVTEGIRVLSSERKRSGKRHPEIILQFLVLSTNEHQVDDIRRKGKTWGADRVVIKTAQLNDFINGHPLMPRNPAYSRYKMKAGTFSQRNPLPDHCFRMWAGCVVTWDGKVVPCCFDKHAIHELGDLAKESLTRVWKGKKYQDFRRRILNSRKTVDICSNCTEGLGWSRWI
jgi:radical SAM protein with 4Fe4S-binding SPASM domain